MNPIHPTTPRPVGSRLPWTVLLGAGALLMACGEAGGGASSGDTGGGSSSSASTSSGGGGSTSSSSSTSSGGSSGVAAVDFAADCVDDSALDIHAPLGGALSLPADRGRVLGCVKARRFTAAQLQADMWVENAGVTALGGMDEYIIQYVSEGPPGVPRRVTGVVALPTGAPGPYPVLSWAHGTTGFGPPCGISRDRFALDYVMMPMLAAGYAVVATDYANLGVPDGVSPYAVGEPTAYNVLDALRAARALDASAAGGTLLGSQLFLSGHSQGGHAALWAHQVWETDPVDGLTLLGTLPMAPAFGIPYGMGGAVAGSAATDAFAAFALVVYYAHGAWKGFDPSTWLKPDVVTRYPQLSNTLCSNDLYAAIPQNWPSRTQIFQDAFRANAATCAFDGSACPQFEPWATTLYESTPGYFQSDVPVLMLQGANDQLVSEFSVACIQAALRSRNTTVRTCKYPATDHYTIGVTAIADMLEWMAARRTGTNPDLCVAEVTQSCPVN
jgi:pimeloyl-ACP methyl ester carboxylesterase